MEKLVKQAMWVGITALMITVLNIIDQRWIANAQLSPGFYSNSCPNMESVIQQVIQDKLNTVGPIAASETIRLFFHDCFVEGCDASVLIVSTNNNVAERDATPNLSLGGTGFDTVVEAKTRLEAQCPGVVSCADILAVAARDYVTAAGGPTWIVEKGRKDGRVSMASHAVADLPNATSDVNQLTANFAAKRLTQLDMIILSGAHTLGFSHCDQFSSRLYTFSSQNATDPSLNPDFAAGLKTSCPQSGGDLTVVVPFDAKSPFTFDNAYYQNLVTGMGLLTSDEILFTDDRTMDTVLDFAQNSNNFFSDFAIAMVKLGRVGVKDASNGEIRKDCTLIN
ncbi:hypothetical protein O6H91_21G015700 [Diphasiastrum complanatum]|uniref:Uncharacterized protein n=1 Tax=Diphasiastrum complanatum TaxID=34168 RepID=A0ACC2AIA0_DIPCM|nr:hypothetical protein O6H91_21G015700 [Diphasiastrum complanatum]